jgi:hypothetical protein
MSVIGVPCHEEFQDPFLRESDSAQRRCQRENDAAAMLLKKRNLRGRATTTGFDNS